MRKINVGLSVQINDKNDSFWVNGIKQNAVTLRDMFELCPNVGNATLVNLGKLKDYKDTAWEEYQDKLVDFDTFVESGDVLITATVSPNERMVEVLKSKNIPLIKHTMGNELLNFQQAAVLGYKKDFNTFARRENYKAVWISPHLYEQNKGFLETVCDAPASIGPYIWTPRFIEKHVERFVSRGEHVGFYEPLEKKERRISVFEPNITLEKTSIHPMIAIEKFYQKHPDLVEFASCFGAEKLKNEKIFVEWASTLDVAKNKKIFFEARYPIVWSLFKHTDIVLCHQDMLPLNYIYFDAAWLGYPVVHNAYMVKDLGFYYSKWDADRAADLLHTVATKFDSSYHKSYMKRSKKIIKKYFWNNPKNVDGYAKLLEDVLK